MDSQITSGMLFPVWGYMLSTENRQAEMCSFQLFMSMSLKRQLEE